MPLKQSGAVLAVSLLMLAVATLIGGVAITLGTTNLRLAGNMQAQKEVESAMQTAIEDFLSTNDPFKRPAGTCDPALKTVTVNGHAVAVDLDEPICLAAIKAPGYTVNMLAPEDTVWEIRGTAWDTATGTRVAGRQGITIRLLAGNCPATPTGTPCP